MLEIILIYILALILSFASLYVVSIFSSEQPSLISIWLATWSIWWISLLLGIFAIEWLLWLTIYIIASMIIFIKFLWFEWWWSFFASILYAFVYNSMLIFVASIIYKLF